MLPSKNRPIKAFIAIMMMSMLMSSCSVLRPRTVNTVYLDYTPYTADGFFISPDPYPGKHETIGELSIQVIPAIEKNNQVENKKGNTVKKFNDGIYISDDPINANTTIVTEKISSEELLSMIVEEARSRGAKGISNLEISSYYNHTYYRGYHVSSELEYYLVTGTCIIPLD